MSPLDERREHMERKLAQDSEFNFKATMRRNKLLGLWAAEQLGLTGDAAGAYAASVVKSDFEEVGDEDVIRKVLGDFTEKGLAIDDAAIRARLAEYLEAAAEQLMAGE